MMADTREQAAALNGAIRDRLVAAGHVDDTHAVATNAGERLGVGDRVATRRNDRDLGVTQPRHLDHHRHRRRRQPHPPGPTRHRPAHPPRRLRPRARRAGLRDHGLRRPGRDHPHRAPDAGRAHLGRLGLRRDDPRPATTTSPTWSPTTKRTPAASGSRCSPGTGPTSAPRPPPQQAAEDIERYGTQQPTRPLEEVLGDLWTAWTRQADLHEQHQRLVDERDALQQVAAIHARYTPDRDRLRGEEIDARRSWLQARQQVDDLDAALNVRDRRTSRRGSGPPGARSSHRRSEPPRSSVRAPGDSASTGDRSATPAPT